MNSYKETISSICESIHTAIVDFSEPRSEALKPTQASSEFITKKQQGDWAEDVLFRAINDNSTTIVAVRYGKSDDLVAGEDGFDAMYNAYQKELDSIGKRPDLLLFRKEDFNPSFGHDISDMEESAIHSYVSKAVAGIEVRSSAFLVDKYTAETDNFIIENQRRVLELRDNILQDYSDLLQQKREELIPLLEAIDERNMRSISFRVPAWRASARLLEASTLLSELKTCLKIIQKRNSLSITPKAEDLKVVHKWIMTYDVPHFYVQVFFDKVYGISFQNILELISNPDLEGDKYFIEQDNKNQNKTTIKIPLKDTTCIAQAVREPHHRSIRKELPKGRLLFYVKFDGGEVYLNLDAFQTLFGVEI